MLNPYAVKFPEQGGKLSNYFEQVGEEFKIFLSSKNLLLKNINIWYNYCMNMEN